MKKIVIVGGGTAGWLTALHIQNQYKDSEVDITLIESEDIGILGAGEGSVPNFYIFLEELKINVPEFILKTNSTHKMGINFVNWNGDGKSYFHSFNSHFAEEDYTVDESGNFIGSTYLGYLHTQNLNLNDYIIPNKLALENKSPLIKIDDNKLKIYAKHSFHFDAHLVAKYLREVAESRGVKRVEGLVKGFNLENEKIQSVILANNFQIKSDFVFDCSGFNRLIIGKLFKEKWKSYSDQLKVNRAVTFNLPTDSIHTGPYTNAIAMKYGWMWQIPLQNRIGCGYNFDNTYISDADAVAELETHFGFSIPINRYISYDAGRYEKAWVNNCIAVGLSLGFTEPIEATSIFHIIAQLRFTTKDVLDSYNNKTIEEYNNVLSEVQDSTMHFLYFHYFTKRKDTPFWTDYLSRTTIPLEFQGNLAKWNFDILTTDEFEHSINTFKYHNWLSVGVGLDFFKKKLYISNYEKFLQKDKIKEHHQKLIESYLELQKIALSEDDFFKELSKKVKND